MDSLVEGIAEEYQRKYGEDIRSATRLHGLYDSYVRRRESTLLDAAAATAAIDALFFADQIDLAAVTPQMREAFARAYPGRDLAERLEELGRLEPESPEVLGFLSNWKGVYHEVFIRDRLNDGNQLGSIALGEGQRAELAENLNQPGFDLRILNTDGTENLPLQAKATSEIALLHQHVRQYPDISILSTSEVAEQFADDRVFSSGVSNEELQKRVVAPMEEEWDGHVDEFVENVLPGLPFVIIATVEGARVVMGRQSFERAMHGAVDRGTKTGTAMGVGALMALAGAGVFSFPATFFTRLGIDRAQVHARLASKVREDTAQLIFLTQGNAS